MYTAFDNIHAFSKLDDTDIAEMEKFAKEDIPEPITPDQYGDFYGIYVNNIKMFRILQGHKKLLYMLSDNAKAEVKYEESERKLAESATKRKMKKIAKAACSSLNTTTNIESATGDTEDTIQDKTIKHTEHIAKEYLKKNSKELSTEQSAHLIENLPKLKVTLSINTDFDSMADSNEKQTSKQTIEFAKVECCMCDLASKDFPKDSTYGRRWILSNFNKHIRTHFCNELKNSTNTEKPLLKNTTITSYFLHEMRAINSDTAQTAMINLYRLTLMLISMMTFQMKYCKYGIGSKSIKP